MTRMDSRAIFRRHVVGVDDVLHAEREPVQRPLCPRTVAQLRLGERAFGIEVGKGSHDGIALGDAVETGPGQGRRGEPPGGHRRHGVDRIQLVQSLPHWESSAPEGEKRLTAIRYCSTSKTPSSPNPTPLLRQGVACEGR